MICCLFGAGPLSCATASINTMTIEKNALIIAVDGGYRYLKDAGITPHILIGDFDSLPDHLNFINHTGLTSANLPEVIKLNRIKDQTDMQAALELGIERGCKEFRIYGGQGGSTGHIIANISLLIRLVKNGMTGQLICDHEMITVIHNNKITFSEKESGYISVFSISEKSIGVCETGLKYTLDNYTMYNDNPIGVSNEFVGTRSEISVIEGTLLLIKEAYKI